MILIDRDKLLNHLGAIFVKYPEYQDAYELARSAIRNERLEVKAIPLEWIEKEIRKLDEDIKWAWYYGNAALDKMEYLKRWLAIKLEDFEDWRKENTPGHDVPTV